MTTTGGAGSLRDRAQRAVCSGPGGLRMRNLVVNGSLVAAGVILMLSWSVWMGLIVVLIGLATIGAFAKAKW